MHFLMLFTYAKKLNIKLFNIQTYNFTYCQLLLYITYNIKILSKRNFKQFHES